MTKTDILVVGGGPGGLGAAIEAARMGAKVMLVDENPKPGGQLYKQIHKFFGSREHYAGVRGFEIADRLIEEARELGVDIRTHTRALGVLDRGEVAVLDVAPGEEHKMEKVQAKKVVLATGAKENSLPFEGWTLPGVMGAGAAQTFANVHGVLVGKDIVVVGSGNVGLIVSYQLMQAGAEVVGIVEGAPKIGGYGVHAGKIRRAGVPIYVGHTIKRVYGKDEVEGVEIAALDEKWNMIPGTEKQFDVDTVCLAVGLNPMTELVWMVGCKFDYIPAFGGHVPLHDENMETTVPGVYVAGDVTGVEEASSAMEEGNMAGVAAAEALGYLSPEEAAEKKAEILSRLDTLRSGYFGAGRKASKEKQLADMKAYKETQKKGGAVHE